MLQHLQLNEDELEDVVLADEPINEYKKDARWLAIGKLFKKNVHSVLQVYLRR
jgi:hypothetical protein